MLDKSLALHRFQFAGKIIRDALPVGKSFVPYCSTKDITSPERKYVFCYAVKRGIMDERELHHGEEQKFKGRLMLITRNEEFSMTKLYRKNELLFSLLWMVSYVVLFSIADTISDRIGIVKIITLPVTFAFGLLIASFIRSNHLWEYYGLCRFKGVKGSQYLYFIPFVAIASSNLWNGVTIRYSALETILFIASMLCVGFIEELIFRGFLFKSIAKRNMNTAIIVSSVTFGVGHIVNLLNGAEILPTVLQIIYATAIGYLFTVFFVKSRNLIPCIAVHGIINALSVFAVEGGTTNQIICTALLTVISLGYAVYLNVNVRMAKE